VVVVSVEAERLQQIADLRKAISLGARKVRTRTNGEEQEVEYRSLAEMRDVLAGLEREAGMRPRVRSSYASHSRGH
jgi:hypothetical protein